LIRSLRGRVFAATLFASLAAVGVALAIGVFTTRTAIRDTYKQETLHEANAVAAQLALVSGDGGLGAVQPDALRPDGGPRNAGGGYGPQARPAPGAQNAGQPDGGPGGPGGPVDGQRPFPRVIAKSSASAVLPQTEAAAVAAGRSISGVITLNGQNTVYAAVPVSGKTVFVFATRPDRIAGGDFSKYLTGLIIAALVAAGLSAAAAALVARRITNPISDVVAASSDLAAGRTPKRLEIPETSELAELAHSFNNMADQLAQAREAERTVLMSASHELRTPLTAITGYAEGIEDGTIDARTGSAVILSESQRLERLVQDLLVLARLEQGTFETHSERVDLAKIAESARSRLALRAADANVSLTAESTPGADALADADRVLQIVTNLVDNAVRVTPAGGHVSVAAAPGRIVVSDTGPGIPAADLPHVFERFHLRKRRGMGSPDGSGIGLAIARELSEAMGGSIAVASTEGAGARFTVTLRRPPDRSPAATGTSAHRSAS
jgi:two-component system OmpR family sensor kinase